MQGNVGAGARRPRTEDEVEYVQNHEDPERSRARALFSIADPVTSSETVANLLTGIAPLVHELTNCDVMNLGVYDRPQDSIAAHFWDRETQALEQVHLPADGFPCNLVWHTQEPVTIPDLERDARFALALPRFRALGIRSYAALPISNARIRCGVLGVGYRAADVDTHRYLEPLKRLALFISIMLENRTITLDRQLQENRLKRLIAVTHELNSTSDFDQLVPLIFATMRAMVSHDFARLSLLEGAGRTLRIREVGYSDFLTEQAQEDEAIPLESALCAEAIASRHTVFCNSDRLREMDRGFLDSRLRSACWVPLIAGRRVLGALEMYDLREDAFLGEDGEYLQQVGSQMAAAIHHVLARQGSSKDRAGHERRYQESGTRTEVREADIVGNSPALKRVLDYAAIVAHTDATVLITGETGTGKERIAHAIHAMSSRRGRSFIKLNCAAIPTGLLESELFGHEKGAFTGAISQKVGRLELADLGTLLLDEVGEIPLELQPKLLRVLQDQEFERLGGTRTIRVNVRLIAASNRDLLKAVENKEFRSDLFYRLHVFPVHLPPLRERREDIPLLVRYFVERCAARLEKRIDLIPDTIIQAMMNYSWPGNIRELENFIERSVILSEGERLCAPLAELRLDAAQRPMDSEGTLRDRERKHITETLRQTQGVLSGPSGAAARLGLKRTTLQYKMEKLGISRREFLD